MSTEKQLDGIRRQTIQYKYIDGFTEIALGSIFVVASIFLTAIFSLDKDYVWLVTIGAVSGVFAVGFLLSRIVNRLKANITYPRTGYVEYKEANEKRLPWLELALAAFLIVIAWFLKDTPDPLPIFNGLVLAIVLGVMGMQNALKRFYVVAIIAFLLGIAFTLADFSTAVRYIGPYAGTGLALIVSGFLTFNRYLQAHSLED